MVDPGGDLDVIETTAKERRLLLKRIWITHGHIDHAGGAAELSERHDLPIEGPHQEDEFLLNALTTQGEMFGVQARCFTPNRWLDTGDTLSIGKESLVTRRCPGHTPGHVIFYHQPGHLALVGDVLFAGSIGRTDLPRGNHAHLINSIRNELWPLGDDVDFVPGHGAMSTFGRERATNPFVADHLFG